MRKWGVGGLSEKLEEAHKYPLFCTRGGTRYFGNFVLFPRLSPLFQNAEKYHGRKNILWYLVQRQCFWWRAFLSLSRKNFHQKKAESWCLSVPLCKWPSINIKMMSTTIKMVRVRNPCLPTLANATVPVAKTVEYSFHNKNNIVSTAWKSNSCESGSFWGATSHAQRRRDAQKIRLAEWYKWMPQACYWFLLRGAVFQVLAPEIWFSTVLEIHSATLPCYCSGCAVSGCFREHKISVKLICGV